MKSEKRALNALVSWALFWFGAAASIAFVSVALAAYSSLQAVQTASTGSGLSSTEWNKMAANFVSVDAQLAALWALAYKSDVGSSDIADGTVWTADIAASAVTDAKIATGILPSKIAQSAATSGQVLKWNGSAWAPAADSTGTSGGITAVTTASCVHNGGESYAYCTATCPAGYFRTGCAPGWYWSSIYSLPANWCYFQWYSWTSYVLCAK